MRWIAVLALMTGCLSYQRVDSPSGAITGGLLAGELGASALIALSPEVGGFDSLADGPPSEGTPSYGERFATTFLMVMFVDALVAGLWWIADQPTN